MAQLRGTIKISWAFSQRSIVAEWELRENVCSSFNVVHLQIPHLSNTELRETIRKKDPSNCILLNEDLEESIKFQDSGPPPHWVTWWLESVRRSTCYQLELRPTLVLIVPKSSGYILRSDIFKKRLAGCDSVEEIFSELEPCQLIHVNFDWLTLREVTRFGDMFINSICGVLFKPRAEDISDILEGRLSLSLFMKGPVMRKKIALVGGGFTFEFRKDLFAAATELGIDLVVLDEPGHWLQKPEMKYLIEAFLPVDLSVDDGLATRIVAVLEQYTFPVDGITTTADRYLCATAIAATCLLLPTPPLEAFKACTDKSRFRELVPIPDKPHIITFDKAGVIHPSCGAITYPVIVKPTQGGGSFGVFLTRNAKELMEGVKKVSSFGTGGIIEPYLDGPEVDINIVMQHGRVIFWEVSDDLPCTAEGFPNQFPAVSWTETGSIYPSGLPSGQLEQLLMETTSHLLKLGFSHGVFHCEARMQESGYTYQFDREGWPHLRRNHNGNELKAVVAMIEINARAPGCLVSAAKAYAYGIDYFAIQLMSAIGDEERFGALSVPYLKSPIGWWECAAVPAEQGGIFHPICMFEELTVSSPELMKHVVEWKVLFREGEVIRDPNVTGKTPWIAWFLVHSGQSRSHLRGIAITIRSALKFAISTE
ncbi:hypothetical protein EV426DRAFT_554227 [Tirmania nivea]|nr:hypothetical protein EV426DRAFT_554227 [Tirmania nivea]